MTLNNPNTEFSTAQTLKEELESLRQIFNTSPDAQLITRLSDGVFIDVNNGFLVMHGYTREELVGSSTLDIHLWVDKEDRQRFTEALRENGMCENREYLFRRKDGTVYCGSLSARIITIRNEEHIVSVARDITERKQVEAALQDSESLYRSILEASPDDITITDLAGRLLIVSPAAHRLFGYPLGYSIAGMTIADFLAPADLPHARQTIADMHAGTYIGPNTYRGVRMDGSQFDLEVSSGFIRDAEGAPTKMVFIARDISERKQSEQKIRDLVRKLEIEKAHAESIARTDSLTGVANRRHFDEALQMEFSRFKRSGTPFSIILLDIDHFKNFNDYYGHVAGDECLKQVAALLQKTAGRPPDFIARYGGEEFAIILPGTDSHGATILTERVNAAFHEQAIPHKASETAPFVTVSLGVITALCGTDLTAQELVMRADGALYQAKINGRNRHEVAEI